MNFFSTAIFKDFSLYENNNLLFRVNQEKLCILSQITENIVFVCNPDFRTVSIRLLRVVSPKHFLATEG